jgi:hypothetical protein
MITKEKVLDIKFKIKEALSKIEKEENVEISFDGGSYNSMEFKTKLVVTSLEKNEDILKNELFLCRRVGFTQNVIGKEFNFDGQTFLIKTIKTRNRKYPVIAENKKGKSYKFTVNSVKEKLGGDKLINRNANLENLLND